jgi:diguanylate cyclase (GGDEF)-like protein
LARKDGERQRMTARIKTAWRLPGPRQIGADQLSAVVSATPAALLCGLVNTGIVAFDLWNVVSRVQLLAWLLCSLVVAAGLSLRRGEPRGREATSLSPRALRRTVLLAAVSACPWASLGVLYLGGLPHTNELILIAICAGMSASGSILLAPIYPAALIYMAIILLPVAVKCFAFAGPGYHLLGLLTLSYGAFLSALIATCARLSVERTEAIRALTRTTRQLKERDELITAQNLRFETALNNMSQGLCFFDGDERLIVCNRRYIDLYGLDAERVRPGVHFRDIVNMRYTSGACPEITREDYLAWRSDAGRAQSPSDTVHRLQNGRIFAIHYRPMADGAWVATTDDITERQHLSERLAEQHKLLEEHTALLQAIIDNFPGGIGFYDKDLRVVVCNDKAKAILDLPEKLFAAGPPRLEDILRFNAERGEYGPGCIEEQVSAKLALIANQQSYRFERSRPDGTVLDVRGAPVGNAGFITTYMDITERYRAEAKIAHLATHDSLTSLPNRVLFRERLDNAVAASRAGHGSVSVLMIDLNRFKHVNDTLGHPMGDLLLKAVADRIGRAVRAEDTVARLGGDEFAVVVYTFDPAREAASIASRIQQALAEPFELDGHTLHIGASIGIAVPSGQALDADRLIKEADIALYRAKAEGGDRARFFEPGMEQATVARSQRPERHASAA